MLEFFYHFYAMESLPKPFAVGVGPCQGTGKHKFLRKTEKLIFIPKQTFLLNFSIKLNCVKEIEE